MKSKKSFLLIIPAIMAAIGCFLTISSMRNGDELGASSIIGILLLGGGFMIMMISVIIVAFKYLAKLSPTNYSSGTNYELNTVTIIDKNGKVRILKQLYLYSNEYRDQDGNVWKTYDDGATFEISEYGPNEDIKAKDQDGNEKIMKRTRSDFMTDHYQDKDGEEYKSYDHGQTFEHVVTHAKVKGEDGKEYELRAIQAGINRFVDQNGDDWVTFDEGKTFERLEKK